MTKPWLGGRGKALEDEYFWKKEQELLARLKAEGRHEREQRAIRARLQIEGDLPAELLQAGFTPDTLELLYLVPLIEVAWAEGEVAPRERELILALAERRGIVSGDPAYAKLTGYLDKRPTSDFFDLADRGASALMATLSPAVRDAERKDLVKHCTRVAEVAGGILGMAAISPDERQAIEHIEQRLSDAGRQAAKARLDSA